MVEIGDIAPDFTLEGTHGDEIREFTLSDVAEGHPTVLVFYIYDFSPVCTDQMCEINDMEMLTFNDDTAILGISTDGPYSHQRFIAENDISYPLLTDDDMSVYEQYGMIEHTDGKRKAKRGIVVVDGDREVRYKWQAESNWDEWKIEPVSDVNDVVSDLIA
jgi:peroxiredoxin